MRYCLFHTFLAGFFYLSVSPCIAQQTLTIGLKHTQNHQKTAGYYIREVVEDSGVDGNYGRVDGLRIIFDNGLATTLKGFLDENLDEDRKAPGITLHITELKFDIKHGGGVYSIDTRLGMCYYIGGTRLLENTGTGKATLTADPGRYMDEFVRKTMKNSVAHFNNWWNANRERIPVADTVTVIITGEQDKGAHPNLLRYTRQRPLALADFRGHAAPKGIERASTYSGTGMGFDANVENGNTVVRTFVTAWFDRDSSWFLKGEENERVLAHEQTHFDITALKACELVRAIQRTRFSRDNYAELLGQMRNKYAEESNEMQLKYDQETNHGINRDTQQRWQEQIKGAIDGCGCY